MSALRGDTGSIAGEGWVEIGRVRRTRGLDGALTVDLYGDDAENVLTAAELCLRGGPGQILFRVRSARALGDKSGRSPRVELELAGLDSKERAERWLGAAVLVPEASLQPLPEGEFYWRQILGLRVRLPDGREIGAVDEIWPTGAHDLLVVGKGSEPILIPAVDPILVRVDLEAGEIWVDPPDGLIP